MGSLETLLASLKATLDQAQQPSNMMQGPVIKLECQQVDGSQAPPHQMMQKSVEEFDLEGDRVEITIKLQPKVSQSEGLKLFALNSILMKSML